MQDGGALVVVAHEDLGGEQTPPAAVTEVLRQQRLELEVEDVGRTAGDEVRLVPDAVEVVVGGQGRLARGLAEESVLVKAAIPRVPNCACEAQITACRSRRPPALSFRLGSSRPTARPKRW